MPTIYTAKIKRAADGVREVLAEREFTVAGEAARFLVDDMKERGWTPGTDVNGAVHDENFWLWEFASGSGLSVTLQGVAYDYDCRSRYYNEREYAEHLPNR